MPQQLNTYDGHTEENYEIHNPEIKVLLKSIAGKISPACPEGWGFLLMIFEFGKGKANFYMSNAAREDTTKMLREWLDKQGAPYELNPENKTTQALRNQWSKIVAILLHKLALSEVVITSEDIHRLEQLDSLPTVFAHDKADGLHIRLVTKAEAEALAQKGDTP